LNGAEQSVKVISAWILAQFRQSLDSKAISIAQAPAHDPVEKIKACYALLESLFLLCILLVRSIADELAR